MSQQSRDHDVLHQHDIPHSHDHEAGHGHTHSPEHIKRVSNRLARAIGHLESVKKWWRTAGTAPRSSSSWPP